LPVTTIIDEDPIASALEYDGYTSTDSGTGDQLQFNE
jgi:hypothetical protein